MRAKGILAAALAGGILLLAPGFEGARADDNHRHRHNQQQTFQGQGHGHGWLGRQHFGDHRDGRYAYGKRARNHYQAGLTKHDRKKLKRIRQRFDNERAFRRHLRHNRPGLFARYMDQRHHQRHRYADDNRRRHSRAQIWYRSQVLVY